MPSVRTFRVPLLLTAATIVVSGAVVGATVALVIALLAVLEISISFDNAIVNAAVLKDMSPRWQQVFLTWGIAVAVFGMRLAFPIVIVAAAAGVSIPDVVNQAINHPSEYAEHLRAANVVIASFGGIFLLMVFLNFFIDGEKDIHWMPVEHRLAGIGNIDSIAPAIAGAVLLLISQIVDHSKEADVLVAGLSGLVAHLLVSGIADRLETADPSYPSEPRRLGASDVAATALGTVGRAGLTSFLYLELLDASFSFDGVIGAFAISKEIFVIAFGLGLGALYIRTLTVHLVRTGMLSEYRYLEHGAHWAIGMLAVLLFIGIEHHVPEVVTGLAGAALILVAFMSSVLANKREQPAAM